MITNPNDLREVGWLHPFAISLCKWLNPFVYAFGLSVAACAFRRCNKRGYLVIAIYFALMLFLILAMPPINRAIRSHRKPDLSEETMKNIEEAMTKARDRVLQEAGNPPAMVMEKLNFPIAPALLVIGLWLLA